MDAPLDRDALRRLVREVLREVVPAAKASAAPREETVAITGDDDLARLVARIAHLCEDAGTRAELAAGRYRFRLAAAPGATSASASARVDKGVVSEAKVVALARNTRRIVLARGAVVTPLARDKARQLGVKLEREKP